MNQEWIDLFREFKDLLYEIDEMYEFDNRNVAYDMARGAHANILDFQKEKDHDSAVKCFKSFKQFILNPKLDEELSEARELAERLQKH